MEQPLISVIAPVYKVEKYLPDCMESLIHQTYQNLEIIMVDDCSPDESGAICDRYAMNDKRIKAFHRTENHGASGARNLALDQAKGKYLFFIDSDDWIAPDTIEYLYENMKTYQADCTVGGCVTVIEAEDGSLNYQKRTRGSVRCENARGAMKGVLLNGSAAWNRLYRREVFDQIRFPEGRINEDEYAVLRLYSGMERIVFLDKDTYFYRKRKNSITTAAFSLQQLDCVTNSRENLEFVTQTAPDLIPAAQFKYIKSMLWCYVNLRKIRTPQARSERQRLHRNIRENRSVALHNPHLGIMLKVLALICSL